MAITITQGEHQTTSIVPVRRPTGQINESSEPEVDKQAVVSQGSLAIPTNAELLKLDEVELKAAIKSAWKKHERLAKEEMAPLLYLLRRKLRAQGSRNDVSDEDRGFGAWIEDNLDISRRTADRWADEYALENGLKERAPTSGHMSKSDEDAFYEKELRKPGATIQFTVAVSQKRRKQYDRAVKTLMKHFNISNEKEAVIRGVCYAAKTIAPAGRTNRTVRTTAPGRQVTRLGPVPNPRRVVLHKSADRKASR